jgi:hypothetical protein
VLRGSEVRAVVRRCAQTGVVLAVTALALACGRPSRSECNDLVEHTGELRTLAGARSPILMNGDGSVLFTCGDLTRAQYNCIMQAKEMDRVEHCDGIRVQWMKVPD